MGLVFLLLGHRTFSVVKGNPLCIAVMAVYFMSVNV